MHHEHDPEDWEGDLPATTRPQGNVLTRLKAFMLRHWHPEPIPPPFVDPDLEKLSGVERSAEVVRYSILSLEFWLSPKGWLREWLRLNWKLGLVLLIPVLLVVPIITFALGQFCIWAALIAATTSSIILFPLSALLVIGLICGLLYIGKTVMIFRSRNRRDQQYFDRY
jgi:hypothetical protein